MIRYCIIIIAPIIVALLQLSCQSINYPNYLLPLGESAYNIQIEGDHSFDINFSNNVILFPNWEIKKKWILVVGVSKYKYLPSVKLSEYDATKMAIFFASQRGDKETVLLMGDVSISTFQKWMNKFQQMLNNNIVEKQAVFFYFSGHSYYNDAKDETFLCFSDTKTDFSNALPTQKLAEWLSSLSVDYNVNILDTCISTIKVLPNKQKSIFMCANSNPGGKAYQKLFNNELSNKGGIFTNLILDEIKNCRNEKHLTVYQFFENIRANSIRLLEMKQIPDCHLNFSRNEIFVRYDNEISRSF